MTDNHESPDMMLTADAKDPMERTDPAEPTLPMESTEPIDPTDRTELREPIDRTESRDQSDHREPLSRRCTGVVPTQGSYGQTVPPLVPRRALGARALRCQGRMPSAVLLRKAGRPGPV